MRASDKCDFAAMELSRAQFVRLAGDREQGSHGLSDRSAGSRGLVSIAPEVRLVLRLSWSSHRECLQLLPSCRHQQSPRCFACAALAITLLQS